MKILLHIIWFLAAQLLGLHLNYWFPITRHIPNFWLLGPAGDMAHMGIGLMYGCFIYVFSSAALPTNPPTTYKARVGKRLYHTFMVTYAVMLLIILFARQNWSGTIELVPLRSTIELLTMIYHHTVNRPYAWALLVGNIILFTPLAYYMRPHFKSPYKCYLALLAIFIVLESLQFLTNRGAFDIDDLIKYSIGVPLGFSLRKRFPLSTSPSS